MVKKAAQKAQRKLAAKVDLAKSQAQILELAKELYEKAAKLVETKHRDFVDKLKASKDGGWYFTMLGKGTATDKISALAMLV